MHRDLRRLCWMLLALPLLATAQVYKYQDENGKWHFTDRPPKEAEAAQIDSRGRASAPVPIGGNLAERLQSKFSPSSAAEIASLADACGIAHLLSRRPRRLSQGERQRVAICRALVTGPELVMCDEPTGNLDPATSVGIMRLLDRINRTGTTVVMATHDSSIVNTMRRRVIELDRGQIVRDQARGVYE